MTEVNTCNIIKVEIEIRENVNRIIIVDGTVGNRDEESGDVINACGQSMRNENRLRIIQ